ncbi:hypothetical protein [Streptomyces sp. 2A115]|uniref:hypothetical protein n=1 Tax=Streptomyces sp. 2A115 TaxID=3457439 RepID=UPI003FD630B8
MEGLEAVEGYRPPDDETVMAAEGWTAPTAEPRDIGEASFGPAQPLAETVHGPDDRVRITDTSAYPWRAT